MHIAIGPGWASHLPVTMALLRATDGPVVELGCGIYSTPVMHWECEENGREMTSYEAHPDWCHKFKRFNRGRHRVIKVDSYEDLDLSGPVSLALVDHTGTHRRYRQALRLAHADFVVIHDAARAMGSRVQRSKMRNAFEHRFRYSKFHPETLILSNRHNPQKILDLELTEQA